jgi:hypothetical protein
MDDFLVYGVQVSPLDTSNRYARHVEPLRSTRRRPWERAAIVPAQRALDGIFWGSNRACLRDRWWCSIATAMRRAEQAREIATPRRRVPAEGYRARRRCALVRVLLEQEDMRARRPRQ